MISIKLDIDQVDEVVYKALEELNEFLEGDEQYVDAVEDQREKLKGAVNVLIDWFKVPEAK